MNYTNKFVAIITFLIIEGFSFYTNAQSNKKNFEFSVFSSYQTMPTNNSAVEKNRKIAKQQFAGWTVANDKINGTITDIYGTPIDLIGATLIEKAKNCLSNRLNKFGINNTEWIKVSEIEAPKASYVNFKQVVNGHDVVFSKMGFRFTKDGNLARIQIKNYGSPNANVAIVFSAEKAKSIATNDLKEVTTTNVSIDPNWAWFPIPEKNKYELHPAWHFIVIGNTPGSVPLKLTGYIDALTGKILYRTNEVKETSFDVTVKGVVYKNGMLNPTSLEPLPNLQILLNGVDTVYTDSNGYANSTLSLPQAAIMPLKGMWSTVIDSITGLNPNFIDSVTTAGSVYTYPTVAPSSDRHVNAYYHVNRVHNFMKKYYPFFTGMDFSLPTKVDEVGGTCNAFYDGTSINFYAAGGGCYSFATFGDVIYHEYGHGITDHFYTDITTATIVNGSLGEALSDIWALSITHSPIMAANAFTGYGGFIRRYDMTPQVYPLDLNTGFLADVHENGQIIAGTWWDVGVNLGSVDSMTKLFTDVYYDVPDGPTGTEGAIYQSILIDALHADDNDNNLSNGTPHYAQIVAAFARHGIYMEGDATITHTEIKNQPRDTSISVNASLTLSRPQYFHDLTLNYRINDTGTWQSVLLTGSGMNFHGLIPAQSRGSIVDYYFTIHDSLNIANAYFPITCDPNNAAFQSSIPYQFGVGLIDKDSINFEGATTGWGIGSNPGDNATAGTWQQAVPAANLLYNSWPGADHTTGTGKCLITGSGAFSFTNPFGQPVANGTTTVLSPLFDVSGFAFPVISYYRWFSNDQGANFKNDPWVVKIQDSTNGAWQTVERTYQSDVEWRKRIFQLHTYLPTSTKFRVKFQVSDSVLSNWENNGQSTTVGGMDDFFIYDIDTSYMAVKDIVFQSANIYPNPADNKIEVLLPTSGNGGMISLYDITGNMITTLIIEPNRNLYIFDTKLIPTGQYLVIIQSEKMVQTKKVVVVHN